MEQPQIRTTLPENAYRELKPGEAYTPMVPPGANVPEVSMRSIIFGLIMNVIFAMAATYLALKIGQGIETAIPISILAVGLSGFLIRFGLRGSSLLENVNVLAIGTTSGIVAGGTVFTMPAIYVLGLPDNEELGLTQLSLFFQIFLVPFLGAVLGVLFLIPFRRYFVKDMHGKLPFPEATATNEILVQGSGGGAGALVLVYSFLIGAAYNFASGAMKFWTETFETTEFIKAPARSVAEFFETVTYKVKAVFSLGTGAEFMGLGFIIGVRFASIIVAGSFLSWFVIIPMLAQLDFNQLRTLSSDITATSGQGPVSDTPIFALPPEAGALLDTAAGRGPTAAETEAPAAPEGATAEISVADAAKQAAIAELAEQLAANGVDVETMLGDEVKVTYVAGDDIMSTDERPFWLIQGEKRNYHVYTVGDELAVFARQPAAEDIFVPIPRNIGIGCIFTAGLLSILKMTPIIFTALFQALGGLFSSKRTGGYDRTDDDISYPVLLGLLIVTSAAIWAYFHFVVMDGMENQLQLSLISLGLALGVAFIFTTVSAWAIAMISVTPISGMTVTTIIITAVVLLTVGLPKTEAGMLATLLVGGVVAAALSMAGTLVTEFKIGYWTGATPKKICWSAILASLLASAVVTGTIMILAEEPGYNVQANPDEALAAPQANMMASALQSFIGTGDVPWYMYGVGVVMAVLLQLIGVSPLAFGLGMYLPMELNAPILGGALVALMVKKSSRREEVSKARSDMGILIASGLVAGAAIMGVVKSFISISDKNDWTNDWLGQLSSFAEGITEYDANWYGAAAFVALGLFIFLNCLLARPKRPEPEPQPADELPPTGPIPSEPTDARAPLTSPPPAMPPHGPTPPKSPPDADPRSPEQR